MWSTLPVTVQGCHAVKSETDANAGLKFYLKIGKQIQMWSKTCNQGQAKGRAICKQQYYNNIK